jgi:AcrR family transcriptional regulator
MPELTVKRDRGRPIDPLITKKIADATWKLLANHGYGALTFEAIASEVGCNRAAIYRRHASKSELVSSVLLDTIRTVVPPIDEMRSPRASLLALVDAGVTYLSGDRGGAILNVASLARKSPELASVFDTHLDAIAPHYIAQFRRLSPAAKIETLEFALHTLIGSFLYHLAMRRVSLSRPQIEHLVDQAIALAASD